VGFDLRLAANVVPVAPKVVSIQQPRSSRTTKEREDIANVTMKLLEKTRKLTTPNASVDTLAAENVRADNATADTGQLLLVSKSLSRIDSTKLGSSASALSSTHNKFTGKGNRRAAAGSSARQHQLQVSRLEKEIETLATYLDESTREKEMQRFELGRLRRQVAELLGRVVAGKSVPVVELSSQMFSRQDLTDRQSTAPTAHSASLLRPLSWDINDTLDIPGDNLSEQ
jgi:hypothetical protein